MKLVLLGWIFSALAATAAACEFPSPPRVLLSVGAPDRPGSKLILSWDFDDSPEWEREHLPASATLAKFRSDVRAAVADLSPLSLLKNALALTSPKAPESQNLAEAIRLAPSHVKPIRCWEAVLFSRQTDRMDMAVSPTEFIAFVLRSRSSARLRIYWYTVNQPGIGGLSPVVAYVKQDLSASADWVLWRNVHNHNFFLNQPNVAGVPSPSGPDVGAFRQLTADLGLEEAWITNGFDTLHLSPSELPAFQEARGAP